MGDQFPKPIRVQPCTGCITHTCLKDSIVGQQLDILATFGYDERTNPEDIMKNFGCSSLMV